MYQDVNDITTLITLYCSLVRPKDASMPLLILRVTPSEVAPSRVTLVIQSQFKEGRPKSDDEYLVRIHKVRLSSSEDRRFIADFPPASSKLEHVFKLPNAKIKLN